MEVYAVNAENEFISAATLQKAISEVMDDDRLIRLGFDITVSEFTPSRPIDHFCTVLILTEINPLFTVVNPTES